MKTLFDFVLFEHNPARVETAVAAGIRSFMVDCEWKGKKERQTGADTEISPTNIENIREVTAIPYAKAYCRINRAGSWTASEVECALQNGAARIFLPMVESPEEVEAFLRYIDGKAEAAILVETQKALKYLDELAQLPLDAVYIGLNDLAISRGARSIFASIADGTVEKICEAFYSVQHGFGGVTVLDEGCPVPCKMFMQEMARLNCSFSFLRRSFHKNIDGLNMEKEIQKLHSFWAVLCARTQHEINSDHCSLIDLLREKGLDL